MRSLAAAFVLLALAGCDRPAHITLRDGSSRACSLESRTNGSEGLSATISGSQTLVVTQERNGYVFDVNSTTATGSPSYQFRARVANDGTVLSVEGAPALPAALRLEVVQGSVPERWFMGRTFSVGDMLHMPAMEEYYANVANAMGMQLAAPDSDVRFLGREGRHLRFAGTMSFRGTVSASTEAATVEYPIRVDLRLDAATGLLSELRSDGVITITSANGEVQSLDVRASMICSISAPD